MTDPYRLAARDNSDRLWMPPTGCLLIPALLTAGLLIPGCLAPDPWSPKPQILEHAQRVHSDLDLEHLSWSSEPLASTRLETWVLQGPHNGFWLVTSWTVDPDSKTVELDWSRTEHVPTWTDHQPGPQAQEPLESWPTQGGGL